MRYSGLRREETGVGERAFDVAAFYARVATTAKERTALRQNLVRGLKEYFVSRHGYDRYGAETILMLPDEMGRPYTYGFAMRRILHDRRLSIGARAAACEVALDAISYGEEEGLPYALFDALLFLARHDRLSTVDLRYALVASAGQLKPFQPLGKTEVTEFFVFLLTREEMGAQERLFWAHSLLARRHDAPGSADLIALLLGDERFDRTERLELAGAWVHFRQPRLTVVAPVDLEDWRATFCAQRLPFWVVHSPSWPTASMVRLGLIWLARLGEDPLQLAETYIEYHATYADQVHSAVADILHEHAASISEESLRRLIDNGLLVSRSILTRRKFYRLGSEHFGDVYLRQASCDNAVSVRQWAARQTQSR